MHVLLVHQEFTTEAEPGGSRHYEFGRYLASKGHKLTVVASTVNYQTRQKAASWQKGHTSQDTDERFTIVRAWTYAAKKGIFLQRLLSFFSFMVSAFIKGLMVRKVDVVWGTSPPIFQALTAYLLARFKGVPYLLEIRDLWPDAAIQTAVLRSNLMIWLSHRLEKFLYDHAVRIVVTSPGFMPHLLNYGVPESSMDVVPHGVDVTAYSGAGSQAVRQELGLGSKFVVLYLGAYGLANDLGTVLEAARTLKDQKDIIFVLVGDGLQREKLFAKARADDLQNVMFVPSQPQTRTPAVCAAADVCVATFQALPVFRTHYPRKVFDYMAAGRPTVLAIDGAIREVIEKADGGVFVPPSNGDALGQAALTYYRDPDLKKRQGENARQYATMHFNTPLLAAKMEEVLQKVVREYVRRSFLSNMSKRLLDLTVALAALALLAIPFAFIALAIKLDSRGPIFYRQERVGQRGRLFRVWKLRTMVDRAVHQGLGLLLAEGDPRITRVGKIIREWSFDELPQFINVIKGEMSLVGPRPALKPQVDHYDESQWQRLLVKPGITGWALVNGRNRLTWNERIKYDVWYVHHASFWLDLKILLKTIKVVLVTREGLYEANAGLDDEFNKYLQGD